MTLEGDHKDIYGEIIGEPFEIEGEQAVNVRLDPRDLSESELMEHAKNLAETDFSMRTDIPRFKERLKLREELSTIFYRIPESYKGNINRTLGLIRNKILGQQNSSLEDEKLALTELAEKAKIEFADSDLGEELKQKILQFRDKLDYETYEKLWDNFREIVNKICIIASKKEHIISNYHRYLREADEGRLFGVKLDGKTVAVQAYNKTGEMSNGRKVYASTASTLSPFQEKGLNKQLKELIHSELGDDIMWIAFSKNKKHLENLEKRGWHVVEIDDPHEAVRTRTTDSQGNFTEHTKKVLMKEDYKVAYFDPKIDGK
ncbi:hypothetical protein ACFL21_04930 [Patescibacteria group bacterium]